MLREARAQHHVHVLDRGEGVAPHHLAVLHQLDRAVTLDLRQIATERGEMLHEGFARLVAQNLAPHLHHDFHLVSWNVRISEHCHQDARERLRWRGALDADDVALLDLAFVALVVHISFPRCRASSISSCAICLRKSSMMSHRAMMALSLASISVSLRWLHG